MSKTTTIELRDGDKDELILIFESENVPRIGDWVRFVSFRGVTYFGRVEYVGWCWDVNEPDDDGDSSSMVLIVVVQLTEVEYSVTEDTIANGRRAYQAEQAAARLKSEGNP